MKKIFITLGIIVVLGVVVLVGFKLYNPSEPTKTFTDSTGSYSFEYPASLFVSENNGITNIFASSSSQQAMLAIVAPAALPELQSYIKSIQHGVVTPTSIGGRQAYEISDIGNPSLSGFAIPLGNDGNMYDYIIIGKYDTSGSNFTQQEMEAVAISLKFDNAKMIALAQAQTQMAIKKGTEARLRADLAQLRAQAELYFTSSTGYTGFCNPLPSTSEYKDIRDIRADIISYTATSSLACYAGKSGYAMSVKLPLGAVTCLDSTGSFQDISSMITGPLCK